MLILGLNSASVLAQVNFGTNPASILGIFLAVAGAGLYFLRTVKPELSRDQDIFFAAVGLLCGFILIFQGWRLDPILQFGQLLLIGTTLYFAYESIRLRGIATQQAKRNTPIVDDEREISNRYQYEPSSSPRRSRAARVEAELEPLPYYEDDYDDERPVRGRIPGSRDSRLTRPDYYDDEAPPRRPSRRSSRSTREGRDERSPRRRSSGGYDNRPTSRYQEDDWEKSKEVERFDDDWDKSNSPREARPPKRKIKDEAPRSEFSSEEVTPRRRKRRRPTSNTNSQDSRPISGDDEVISTPYVDFKPVDRPDSESDRPINFDDI